MVGHRICFLHIPKTGGTSVVRALNELYPSRDSVAHLDPAASTSVACALGMDVLAFREQLLLYFLANERLQFVSGHVAWSEEAFERYGAGWHFVTLLRDPIERWLSNFFYDRHKTSSHRRIEIDLEAFLNTPEAAVMGRSLVTHLAGGSSGDAISMMERARANLDRFRIVGFLDDLPRLEREFSDQFGVRLSIPHTNKSPTPQAKQRALDSAELTDRVRTICAPDLLLYEHAAHRLRPVRARPGTWTKIAGDAMP